MNGFDNWLDASSAQKRRHERTSRAISTTMCARSWSACPWQPVASSVRPATFRTRTRSWLCRSSSKGRSCWSRGFGVSHTICTRPSCDWSASLRHWKRTASKSRNGMRFRWASRLRATSDTFTLMSRCACFESLRKRSETGPYTARRDDWRSRSPRSADHIELTITDDGRGFDLEAVRRDGSGLGLVSMEERAHVVGGDLQIITRPGQGTTIRVRIPAVAYAGAEKGHVHEAVRLLAAHAPQRSKEPL